MSIERDPYGTIRAHLRDCRARCNALETELANVRAENERLKEGLAMIPEEKRSYDWALNQRHQSVAARHAFKLAIYIKRALAKPEGQVQP